MEFRPVPFRLSQEARASKLPKFNERAEIRWFGFRGAFVESAWSEVDVERLDPGALGGGGTAALNGGVIAAGFDAAFVLQFLSLARGAEPLVFRAGVTRSSRGFAFAQGALLTRSGGVTFATASAMVAPAG
jgi:hypothetical protein